MTDITSLEDHRPALTGLCYRMLGSSMDADDAVQETMLRAWKGFEAFDGKSAVSTWLYRIATNVCLDQLRSRKRRELPVGTGPAGTVDDALVSKPRSHWLEPVADAQVLPPEASPDRKAELRQSLRLAFVAALQHLPPRQRACLLLKEVLDFSAEEIAETLETSVASVNSALQRARAQLGRESHRPEVAALTAEQRSTVDRYVDAFHRYDVDALVSLLREDGTLSMPPYTLWLQGREAAHDWLLGRGIGCRGSRLVPVEASGSVAFGQYRLAPSHPSPVRDDGYQAFSLIVLELDGDRIASMIHFLDTETLFPLFGLPLTLAD